MSFTHRPSTIRIIVRPGGTVGGTKYFEPTSLDVSDEYARYLVEERKVADYSSAEPA